MFAFAKKKKEIAKDCLTFSILISAKHVRLKNSILYNFFFEDCFRYVATGKIATSPQ
jgi:hypothetical protein